MSTIEAEVYVNLENIKAGDYLCFTERDYQVDERPFNPEMKDEKTGPYGRVTGTQLPMVQVVIDNAMYMININELVGVKQRVGIPPNDKISAWTVRAKNE